MQIKQIIKNPAGFSLLELAVVLTIIGFLAMIASPIWLNKSDQMRYEQTVDQLEELRTALLGNTPTYINGLRQFSGYVYDMGGLPALEDVLGTSGDADDDQPSALWDQGTLPDWEYDADARIYAGWRGSYIESPADDVLKDGWGNPLVFSLADNDLTIESYGADGTDDTGSEAGYDEDIVLDVREEEYRSAVAGRVADDSVTSANARVILYAAADGVVTAYTLDAGLPADKYFRFDEQDESIEPETESSNSGRKYLAVPAGICSIYACDATNLPTDPAPTVLSLEPGGYWIGDISAQ